MFRCAVVFVSLAAVLATASIADAQYFGRNKVRYDRFDFRIIQTEHFDIYYYAQEEDAARHASRMAERWYARFSNVLEHTFLHRQPLVLYASHPHFAQTNVTPAVPGEGTGGLTERNKTRIVMPFAAGLDATDHVLGHEIAHAFQIDMVRRAGRDAFSLPGWFIEGMAEYLSVGPDDSHTAMWLRDASAHRRLPTVEQLNQPRYSPYRYGQAFWTYFAGRYGDKVLARVLRSKVRDAVRRLEEVSGVGRDQLTTDWHESVSADNQDRDARVISPHAACDVRARWCAAARRSLAQPGRPLPDVHVGARSAVARPVSRQRRDRRAHSEDGEHRHRPALRQSAVHPFVRRVGQRRQTFRDGDAQRRPACAGHRRCFATERPERDPARRPRRNLQPELVA